MCVCFCFLFMILHLVFEREKKNMNLGGFGGREDWENCMGEHGQNLLYKIQFSVKNKTYAMLANYLAVKTHLKSIFFGDNNILLE